MCSHCSHFFFTIIRKKISAEKKIKIEIFKIKMCGEEDIFYLVINPNNYAVTIFIINGKYFSICILYIA